jgi:hypothetical protein
MQVTKNILMSSGKKLKISFLTSNKNTLKQAALIEDVPF